MTINSISIGDVLTYEGYAGTKYGVKVLDYTYTVVDGSETKFHIVQSGRVKDNKWVPSEGSAYVSANTTKDLQDSYTDKWVPTSFKKGDFLVSDDGKVFYYESDATVWRLTPGERDWSNGAMHSTLGSREKEYGKLKVLNTGAGDNFNTAVVNKNK